MARPVRVLLFSTLYPSRARPGHGLFVETRLRELLRTGGAEARVVAPVPWFPSTAPRFGSYAQMAATPTREQRNGIDVLHPCYPVLPKVGMTLAPLLLALGAARALGQLRREGFDFDVIDAHYYYPDGVAAALLSAWFNRPLAITARGSDLNLIAGYALPKRMMQWAARRASASIGVCQALVDVMKGWGLDPTRLHVLRNGVDLSRFRPVPDARAQLGVTGAPVLVSVGHLVPLKGFDLVIEALGLLRERYPQACALIVGEGPQRESLMRRASELGLADRVRLVGAVPNDQLAAWYSAADVLVLASSREGWANVLLEAMACGTPVVATNVGGTPEVVSDPVCGRVVSERSANALADAVAGVLAAPPERANVRTYASGFDWAATSQAQLALFCAMRADAMGLRHA